MSDTFLTTLLIVSAMLAWLLLALVIARVLGRVAAAGDHREHVNPLQPDTGSRRLSARNATAPAATLVGAAPVSLH
jgi:hypothetical protein